jgi:lipopolysaccharide/colanic/teichoic acid biosynthesis glycosyltransferase
MTVYPFVASLALSLSVARTASWRLDQRMHAWVYRASVLAGAATVVVWPHPDVFERLLVALGGAFVGGVVATCMTVGFVEDNAPVSQGAREKILAFHEFAALRYPREPPLKRVLDLVVGSAGLLVTLPLWLIVACVIWWNEPGPILFTKNSVGRGGVVFRQIKFRTMTFEAERLTGPIASPPADPRTLRVGGCLRRWHLDEMPELINVVGGTMSLVGPRPLRAVLVQRYLEEVPGFVQRHTVRPGIACIAQIQAYHISPAIRLRKDLAYIRCMSVGLDLRLLCRAVITSVRGCREEI